jgi:sulfite exporter TauE/SafE
MSLFFESFIFGAANSVHCACMCGPLALAFGGGPSVTMAYQASRAAAYAAIGATVGGSGAALGAAHLGAGAALGAYVLAAGLVVLALVGERGALKIPLLAGLMNGILRKSRSLSPVGRAMALGLCTPLLPCGLLWSAFAAASVAGSAPDGAVVMTGFALGSLPLLLLAQHKAPSLARRWSPTALAWLQKGAMLLAAAILVWRGYHADQGGCCS